MPTVPTEQSLGYNAVGMAPTVTASPADFGAQVGQAEQGLGQDLNQASNTAAQIASQQLQVQAEADQNQRFTKLRDFVQTTNYGDPNNPTDRGLYGKKGADFMAAYPAALKSITDLQQSLTTGVAPALRGQFDKISRQLIDPDIRTMGSQFVQQSNAYLDDTSNARIAAAHSDAIANYNNPEKFNNALADSKTQVQLQGIRNGLPPEMIEQNVADNQSKMFYGATMRLAQEDPIAARAFYQQHAAMMLGPYQAEVERQLTGPGNAWKSRQDMQAITSGQATQTAASVADEARNQGIDPSLALTTAKIESGMGRSLVNPVSTAKGVFQLTDSTWAGVGGTLANRDDQAAQVALGVKSLGQSQQAATAALGRPAAPWETYVTHQQGVGGGPALLKADPSASAVSVLAPLYASHGGMQAAEQAIVNNGGTGSMTVGQFLDAQRARYEAAAASTPIPPAGAPGGVDASNGGAGAAPGQPGVPVPPAGAAAIGSTPSSVAPPKQDPRTQLASWLQQASTATDFWGHPDPNYQALLTERIKQHASEIEYVQAQSERATRNTLITAALGGLSGPGGILGGAAAAVPGASAPGAVAPGGASTPPGVPGSVPPAGRSGNPPTSLEGMFAASPASQAAFYAADPETQHSIMEMLHANATQGPPITDAATTQYYQLRSLSATDPEKFLAVNLADPALLHSLPRQYLDPLITIQTSIDKRMVSQQARQVQIVHARSVMGPDLAAAGFTPQATHANPALAQSYADYLGRLDEALEAYKQRSPNGQRADDTAILNIGQTLLQRGAIAGTGSMWGLIGPKTEPLFQAITDNSLDKFMPTIPAADRAQVTAALQARDGRTPTDADVARAWMLTHQRVRSAGVQRVFGGGFAPPSAAPSAAAPLLSPAQVE